MAVAVGYIAAYIAILPLSDVHWALIAGLRLSALLLIPYRYWAALVVADTFECAHQGFINEPRFGLPWAIAIGVPMIIFAMPIVWWCKKRLSLFPSKRLVNFQTLLFCMLLASLTWSLINYGILLLAKNPGIEITPILFFYLFVGAYVATLTTTPWIIIAKLECRSAPLFKQLRAFAGSSLALDAAVILAPALFILSWLTAYGKEGKQIYCLFMFMPVAWLTLKHGWRGAVLGGTAATICICLLTDHESLNPIVVQAKAIIAFAITCLIAFGARISAMHQKEEQERLDVIKTMKLARQSIHFGEMRLRSASEIIEHACGELQLTHNRLLNRFRLALPFDESQRYYKQAETTQQRMYQIANAMHPIAWRQRGLPAALRENIGRVLDEAGMAYRCEITGRGLSSMATSVHTAIYRMACESVAHVYASLPCSDIRITLRGSKINDTQMAILRVEGTLNASQASDAPIHETHLSRLASRLGTTELSLMELGDYARLFGGKLHVRADESMLRITALLHNISDKEREHLSAPAPLRLWAN